MEKLQFEQSNMFVIFSIEMTSPSSLVIQFSRKIASAQKYPYIKAKFPNSEKLVLIKDFQIMNSLIDFQKIKITFTNPSELFCLNKMTVSILSMKI